MNSPKKGVDGSRPTPHRIPKRGIGVAQICNLPYRELNRLGVVRSSARSGGTPADCNRRYGRLQSALRPPAHVIAVRTEAWSVQEPLQDSGLEFTFVRDSFLSHTYGYLCAAERAVGLLVANHLLFHAVPHEFATECRKGFPGCTASRCDGRSRYPRRPVVSSRMAPNQSALWFILKSHARRCEAPQFLRGKFEVHRIGMRGFVSAFPFQDQTSPLAPEDIAESTGLASRRLASNQLPVRVPESNDFHRPGNPTIPSAAACLWLRR